MGSTKIKIGINDLETTHPGLSKEWDYKLNEKRPEEVSKGSHERVYWTCPKGHPSYQARISNRAYKNDGCPICANRKILAGYNDLKTLRPYLAEQWDYTKNYPKIPEEVFPNEGKKYYWICPLCKESYSALVSNRAKGKACPKCSKKGTSFPEQAIYYYLKQIFSDAKNRDASIGVELDVYIPSINCAVEYDGVHFHQSDETIEKDNRKDRICDNNRIKLFRFRDPKLPDTISATRITCIDKRGEYLQEGIQNLIRLISPKKSIKINIEADYFDILAFTIENKKNKSIVYTHPQLAKEWHPTKNLPLSPECVTSGSGIRAWWICSDCGNEYQAYVYRRKSGSGCEKCAIKKRAVSKSKTAGTINNFIIQYPMLAKEVMAERTPSINIAELSAGTQTILWWKCNKCSYEWKASVCHRTSSKNKTGCPECAKRRVKQSAKRAIRNIDTNKIFDSLTEAAESCNGDKRNIQKCCAGQIKSAYGYHWEYADNKQRKSNYVGKLILNVETKEIFKSVTEASKKYKCDRSSISAALNGKTKTSRGYHWKFIDKE